MKARVISMVVLFCSVVGGLAQTYSFHAMGIQPGGVGSGGVYSVKGVVKTPYAWTEQDGIFSGNYQVLSGIMGIYVVQNVLGPRLIARPIGADRVRLYWAYSASSHVLEYGTSLTNPDWSPAPQIPADDGSRLYVDVEVSGHPVFYRLLKPPVE